MKSESGVGSSPADEPAENLDVGHRYTIRADSSLSGLAAASAASDRAEAKVLDHLATFLFDRASKSVDVRSPSEGSSYRFESIAETVSRSVGDTKAARNRANDPWATPHQASTELVRYDGAFAARWFGRDPGPESTPLVFPGFDVDTTFYDWTHENTCAEFVAEVSTIRGSTTAQTYRTLTMAMTLVHGLPQFNARVAAGEFTAEHVRAVTILCQPMFFRYLPELDDYLASRRADVTCETLKAALRKRIRVLQPDEEQYEQAAKRRRVDVETMKDGSACLSLTGPALEVNACFRRVEAMARAVNAGNTGAFGLKGTAEFDDDRGIDALMFDIFTRTRPTLSIQTMFADPVTGLLQFKDEPIHPVNDKAVTAAAKAGMPNNSAAEDVDKGADSQSSTAFSATGIAEPEEIGRDVVIEMPTHDWWLAHQAKLVVTVPYLSAFGDSKLPGTVPDGSPVPAETAKRAAKYSSTLTRILTDPATGTPLDAKATTYRIPQSVRTTVVAQWTVCTAPGCTRRAETSEIDHVDPFFHLDPLRGGHTRFGNLHPLCGKHHAAKTARKYWVTMPESGLVEYGFSHGVKARVGPPDQPVDIAHALELSALGQVKGGQVEIPEKLLPPDSKKPNLAAGDPCASDDPCAPADPRASGDENMGGSARANSKLRSGPEEASRWNHDLAADPPPF